MKNLLSYSLLLKNLKIKIQRTIIVLVVLYGCETWSLTLREEHRLRVLENRVLRRIFRPKTDQETREWKKLHYEEFSDLYSSPNIIQMIKSRTEMGRACGKYGGGERCIQGFGGETRGKQTTWKTQAQMGRKYYDESSGSGIRGHGLD